MEIESHVILNRVAFRNFCIHNYFIKIIFIIIIESESCKFENFVAFQSLPMRNNFIIIVEIKNCVVKYLVAFPNENRKS